MSGLRGYHCNNCGAWLLVGERHSCDPVRLDTINRISDFFSQWNIAEDNHDSAAELKELLASISEPPPPHKDEK